MADYLGPQAWRNELTKLLLDTDERTAAILIGRKQALKPRQIAERWVISAATRSVRRRT